MTAQLLIDNQKKRYKTFKTDNDMYVLIGPTGQCLKTVTKRKF